MNSNDILVALRRITRAIDLRSKELEKRAGLTVPQLLILRALRDAGRLNVSAIARRVSLSQGTATSIVQRLGNKGLVKREPSPDDGRSVLIELTAEGRRKLAESPELLQEQFTKHFGELQGWEQKMLLASVERIADILDPRDEDAAPILQVGDLLGADRSAGG